MRRNAEPQTQRESKPITIAATAECAPYIRKRQVGRDGRTSGSLAKVVLISIPRCERCRHVAYRKLTRQFAFGSSVYAT
jgi:hypothetical protein